MLRIDHRFFWILSAAWHAILKAALDIITGFGWIITAARLSCLAAISRRSAHFMRAIMMLTEEWFTGMMLYDLTSLVCIVYIVLESWGSCFCLHADRLQAGQVRQKEMGASGKIPRNKPCVAPKLKICLLAFVFRKWFWNIQDEFYFWYFLVLNTEIHWVMPTAFRIAAHRHNK